MKFNLLILFMLFYFTCFGQELDSNKVQFSTLEHDFGTLRKYTGEVKYTFEFINRGTLPVVIQRAESECECTSTSWSMEPIAPGSSGSVKVYFNPDNANGKFARKIHVITNSEDSVIDLVIKGNVIESAEKEIYEYSIGALGFKSKHVNMGIINKGEIKTKNTRVINNSNKPLNVEFQDVPEYVTIKLTPKVLKPGQVGNINIEYHSELINDWDYIIDRITVFIDKKKNANKLTITSNIVEDFSRYSDEQLLLAPVANYITTVKQFDTLNIKNIVECQFLVRNEGKSDLIIRDVNPSCGCTAVKPEKNIILPGDSAYIYATFDPSNKTGDFNYSIAVISNDPHNNRQYLWIKGYVKE